MITFFYAIGVSIVVVIAIITAFISYVLFTNRNGLLHNLSSSEPYLINLVYEYPPLSHVVFKKQHGPEFVQIMKVEEDGDEKLLIFIPTSPWSIECFSRIKAIFDELDVAHKMLRPHVGRYREPQLVGNLLLDFEVAATAVNRIFNEVYDNPPSLPIRIKLEAYWG